MIAVRAKLQKRKTSVNHLFSVKYYDRKFMYVISLEVLEVYMCVALFFIFF
jgi:hypothetical protein